MNTIRTPVVNIPVLIECIDRQAKLHSPAEGTRLSIVLSHVFRAIADIELELLVKHNNEDQRDLVLDTALEYGHVIDSMVLFRGVADYITIADDEEIARLQVDYVNVAQARQEGMFYLTIANAVLGFNFTPTEDGKYLIAIDEASGEYLDCSVTDLRNLRTVLDTLIMSAENHRLGNAAQTS